MSPQKRTDFHDNVAIGLMFPTQAAFDAAVEAKVREILAEQNIIGMREDGVGHTASHNRYDPAAMSTTAPGSTQKNKKKKRSSMLNEIASYNADPKPRAKIPSYDNSDDQWAYVTRERIKSLQASESGGTQTTEINYNIKALMKEQLSKNRGIKEFYPVKAKPSKQTPPKPKLGAKRKGSSSFGAQKEIVSLKTHYSKNKNSKNDDKTPRKIPKKVTKRAILRRTVSKRVAKAKDEASNLSSTNKSQPHTFTAPASAVLTSPTPPSRQAPKRRLVRGLQPRAEESSITEDDMEDDESSSDESNASHDDLYSSFVKMPHPCSYYPGHRNHSTTAEDNDDDAESLFLPMKERVEKALRRGIR